MHIHFLHRVVTAWSSNQSIFFQIFTELTISGFCSYSFPRTDVKLTDFPGPPTLSLSLRPHVYTLASKEKSLLSSRNKESTLFILLMACSEIPSARINQMQSHIRAPFLALRMGADLSTLVKDG